MIKYVSDDMFCEIFLDSPLSYSELFSNLFNYMGGVSKYEGEIKCGWCEVSLRHNGYYDAEEYEKNPKDFIFWRYSVEIYKKIGLPKRKGIEQVKKLTENLRSYCNGVVAACDFEDLLQQQRSSPSE